MQERAVEFRKQIDEKTQWNAGPARSRRMMRPATRPVHEDCGECSMHAPVLGTRQGLAWPGLAERLRQSGHDAL
jgi:hypothetical protein